MDESNSNYRISHKLKSPFKAYYGDGKYIFVSYKHKDADIIYPIIKQFHDRGFNIWYDEGLPYGENFDIVIPNKIEGAALFVNFITHECMACANDSEDYMIKESDIAQYLGVPILAIYPQPDVKLKGYYLTNYLKKQSIYKHEYGPNEDIFIDVCIEVFMSKGLNPNPIEESKPAIEEAHDDSLKTEVDETKPAIEEASDDSLMNNAEDIPLFPAYEGDEPYIFVSYSHQDSLRVFAELEKFHNDGYNIWYDEGIMRGEGWHEIVEKSILNSSLLVFFVSENAIESRDVRNSIFLALDANIPVIRIYLEDCKLKYGLYMSLKSSPMILRHKINENEYVSNYRKLFENYGFTFNESNNPPFPAYDGYEPYIFASYSHDDSALVFAELERFYNDGYNIWYDEGMPSGGRWQEVAENALINSSLFVVFISRNSVESKNVRNEIFSASSAGIPILPIFLEPTKLVGSGLALKLRPIQSILKYKMSDEEYIERYRKYFEKMGFEVNTKH